MTFPLRQRPAESYHERPRSFGAPRIASAGGLRSHAGCDLYAAKGTEILACADGTIVDWEAEYYRPNPEAAYVGAVTVWHPELGDSHKIRYGEVDRIAEGLRVGSKVTAGQVIAYVGQVAGMVNAMLHFEAYTGTSVGPLTDVSRPPFMRRADLVDPTELLDAAVILEEAST